MLLDDIGKAITDNCSALGFTTANVFLSKFADTPDTAACVYEYPGHIQYMMKDGAAGYEMPSFQVTVRDPSYSTARTKLDGIKKALESLGTTTINNVKYSRIMANNTALALPGDQHGRAVVAQSFTAMKEPS